MNIKTALSEKSVDYLADLVIKLLDGLEETQRLDFIGKYIGAGLVLEALAKDDEQLLNQEDIICQVDDFCIDCLSKQTAYSFIRSGYIGQAGSVSYQCQKKKPLCQSRVLLRRCA